MGRRSCACAFAREAVVIYTPGPVVCWGTAHYAVAYRPASGPKVLFSNQRHDEIPPASVELASMLRLGYCGRPYLYGGACGENSFRTAGMLNSFPEVQQSLQLYRPYPVFLPYANSKAHSLTPLTLYASCANSNRRGVLSDRRIFLVVHGFAAALRAA